MVTDSIEKEINTKIEEAKKSSGKVRKPRDWIKIDCKGWLHGSLNARMTPAQLCVFSKLLVMAEQFGAVPGLISDNDFRPLPHEYLAHQACCTVELFEETLTIGKEETCIYENSHGIYLVNFDKYQFREYDRQKPYRQARKDDPEKYKRGKYAHLVGR